MCTVLTLDQEQLFGRTMDFPPRTPWKLTYLPVNYEWQPVGTKQLIRDRFAILGGMRMVGNHYLIGDGINDGGLVCAELFFPVAADYGQPQLTKLNLSPQDFIHWVLATHATVKEVLRDLPNVVVIKKRWFDNQQYPFHWLLMDDTGTYGIEPLNGRLTVFENKVGAYTNTPAFTCQLQKLADYQQQGQQPITGRNSTDRFILAARARKEVKDQDELWNFLNMVTVPQTPRHAHNCTHYQAIINCRTGDYSFHDQISDQLVSQNIHELSNQYSTPQRF